MMRIVIGLASNTEDAPEQMRKAMEWIKDTFNSCKFSEVYITDAERGATGNYHNAVAIAYTSLSCEETVRLFKEYEINAGRTPDMKPLHIVPIDLDLVICDRTVLRPTDMASEYFMKGYREVTE